MKRSSRIVMAFVLWVTSVIAILHLALPFSAWWIALPALLVATFCAAAVVTCVAMALLHFFLWALGCDR